MKILYIPCDFSDSLTGIMTEQHETIQSVTDGIYNNLVTSMIHSIVSKETAREKLLRSRYGSYKQYHYDPNSQLDIHGNPKQQDSSQYFYCENCGREVSGNRFAAHLQRCLTRGSRR